MLNVKVVINLNCLRISGICILCFRYDEGFVDGQGLLQHF